MASRGAELERKINKANIKYRKERSALIRKIDLPVVLTKSGPVMKRSTVDYEGLVDGGRAIAFDAKQTKVKTRFDLKNIHDHQLHYLNYVQDLGGISFFLIQFTEIYKNKAYIVLPEIINHWIYSGDRKSIPYKEIEKGCVLTNINNYLEAVITND